MKKFFIIIAVVLALLALVLFGYLRYTQTLSPKTTALWEQNDLNIRIDYCQPAKKGRIIFGDTNALVPYEKVWRTGANESTLLVLNQDVMLAGKPLKAGKYTLWTIPGKNDWQVVINEETGQWGTQYNEKRDLFRAAVMARHSPNTQELFLIGFTPQGSGTDIVLKWDQTEVVIPVRKMQE